MISVIMYVMLSSIMGQDLAQHDAETCLLGLVKCKFEVTVIILKTKKRRRKLDS